MNALLTRREFLGSSELNPNESPARQRQKEACGHRRVSAMSRFKRICMKLDRVFVTCFTACMGLAFATMGLLPIYYTLDNSIKLFPVVFACPGGWLSWQ